MLGKPFQTAHKILAHRRFAATIWGCLGWFLLTGSVSAQTVYLPSVKIGTAALISPSDADLYYGSATTSTDGLAVITGVATPTPPEIAELARALHNNVDEIYDYVRNNIEISWTYGLQKGAVGAIVDKSGTAFDQAALMVALLRQAGYTASYVAGTVTLSGADFAAWSGITDATAACQLLSSGGIPAAVNGSTSATCAYTGTVSTVTLSHIWVSVTIGSANYVFDPAYKGHNFKAGINLQTAAGFTSGAPLTQAATGMESGTASGASYVRSLNAVQLNSTLQTYATNLQNTIQSSLPAGEVEDLVGGQKIARVDAPSGGLRQTALPFAGSVVQHSWTGNIPDQYRTTLRVQITKPDVTGTVPYPTIIDRTVYLDEIYGQQLEFHTNFKANGTQTFLGSLILTDEMQRSTTLQKFSDTGFNPGYSVGDITLTMNLPYAVSADGTATTHGDYMDATVVKHVRYAYPLMIVYALGDSGRGLVDKWGTPPDHGVPAPIIRGCETCVPDDGASDGAGRRVQMAASWLAQATRAAKLNASIANSVYAMHYALGVVAADTQTEPVCVLTNTTVNGDYGAFLVLSNTLCAEYGFDVEDSFDRVDVDSAFSLTSKTANATDRRAAIRTIAATAEALEGSVSAQIADLPDTSSTVTRFEWGNSPPASEDSYSGGAGPRRFYQFGAAQFSSTNCGATFAFAKTEGAVSTTNSGEQGGTIAEPVIGEGEYTERQCDLYNAIGAYSQAGFAVTASEESFLGPGQRGGNFYPLSWNAMTGAPLTYNHHPSKQRGGAFVAVKSDANGDPVEIANIAVGPDANSKGGGGGAQTFHQAQYDPAAAADILKSRFADRSSALGVDVKSGSLAYTSPAALNVGTGDFPYSLSAQLVFRGGQPVPAVFGPEVHSQPETPWTTNWNNQLAVSGSGLEAMGASDVREAAGTVAAFVAAQDIYKSAPTAQSEAAALLALAWWTHQLAGNVATVTVGASSRQFVKRFDGTWFAPGPGPAATLTQTGARAVYIEPRPDCGAPPVITYVGTRGWDYSSMAFDLRNAHGDVQHFAYWRRDINDSTTCGVYKSHGFRLTSWTFPQGVSVNLVYQGVMNAPDALGEVNNSLGRKIDFTVDPSFGFLTSFNNGLTGANARAVTIAANDNTNGTLLPYNYTHTDPAGAQTHFIVNMANYRYILTQVFTANNTSFGGATPVPSLQYDYGPFGQVKQASDADALQLGSRGPWQFFIADGVRGSRTDPLGNSYTVLYDTDGEPFRYIDELGRTVTAAYDRRGRVTQYTYPEGDQELLAYDDRNNVTQFTKVAKPGSGLANLTVGATWDATWNKPLSITDALGRTTTFAYYGAGLAGASLLQSATRPAVAAGTPVYSFAYNAIGKLLTASDPTGLITSNVYDSITGNLTSTTVDPGTGHLAATTSFGYDAQGDVISTDGPRTDVSDVSYATYDGDRRPVFAIAADPDGAGPHPRTATKTVYDAEGRVIEVDSGTTTLSTGGDFVSLLAAKTAYDPAGNKILDAVYPVPASANPSSITQYSYDAGNRLLCTAVRMNRDAAGAFGAEPTDACLLSVATGYGFDRISENLYDAGGQLRQIIRGLGTAVQQVYASYRYSANGKQVAAADADAGVAAGVANADALDISAAHPHQTNYAYDGFDRLVLTLYADGSGDQASYDANGNALARTNRAGEIVSFAYDALNRVVSKVLPVSGSIAADTVSWAYDLAGRITSLSDTAGQSLANAYDSAGRLVATATTIPGLAAKTVSYAYDEAGNRTKLVWPEGSFVSYAYDAANRMIAANDNAGASLATFDYDNLGHPAWEQYAGTGAKVSFSWSNEGDLLTLSHALAGTANDVSYTDAYTPAHQIASSDVSNGAYQYVPLVTGTDTYVPNALNQYASVTPAGAAAPVSIGYDLKGNLTSDGTFAFAYDPENKLVSAAKTGTAAAYAYDPLGRRDEKTVNGTRTYFLSADADEVAEYDGAGTLLRRYIPGPAIDRPIAMVDAAGTKTFFHQDKTGSVVAMSDSAGTKTEGPYTYDSFGNGAPYTGVPYKFAGRRLDPETGLYYYRARYLSTALGRFLQTDSIGYADDINWYTYVQNDPTDKTDPSGLCADDITCQPAIDAEMKMSPEEREEFAINGALAAVPGGLEIRGAAGAGRVFWSGGRGAMEAAAAFARANGGRTLEMTLRGKILTWLTNKLGFTNTEKLWKWLSQSWAKGAKGEADVVLGEKVRPDSIWKKIEERTLQKNGVKINEHPVSEVQSPSSGGRGASQGGGSPDFLHSGDNPNQAHLCTGSRIPTTGSCP